MIKIVSLALIFAIVILYLKSINSELTFLASIGAGIIILLSSIEYFAQTIDFINKLVTLSGIDFSFYKILIKITAIGYLIEFAADTVNDFGLNSLSNKLVFVGKIIILTTSLPILYAVFELLVGILK